MTNLGIYERLINNAIAIKLQNMDKNEFYIKTTRIEKNEASLILTQYLSKIIHFSLNSINVEDSIENQIQLTNKIINLLKNEIDKQDFSENLLDVNTSLLSAILPKIDSNILDFEKQLKEITPYSGLTQSELFTGSNAGISLESELRKEILSSNEIYF
ncbi:MAG: DUF3427 domain-containing protein, partial [Arcobacteraceae bacterium]